MKKYILLSLALLANNTSFANHNFITTSGRTLYVWGWDKKEEKHKLKKTISRGKEVLRDAILSIACSPDGLFFALASRDEIEIWGWDEKRKGYGCIQIISDRYKGKKEKTSYTRSIVFSPDSRTFISGSPNGTIKVWSWNKKEKIWKHKQTLSADEEETNGDRAIFSVVFWPDGLSFVSASLDKTIKIWDWNKKKKIWKHKQTLSANEGDRTGHNDWVTSVGINPNGRCFASGSKDEIKVWNWDEKEDRCICKQTLSVSEREKNGHKDLVVSIVFSPDGLSFVSASLDNTIKVWGWDKKKKKWKHKQTLSADKGEKRGHNASVYSVSFCPDGLSFISGSQDGTIKIWGWDKKKKRWKHKETLVIGIVGTARVGVYQTTRKRGVLAVAFIQNIKKQIPETGPIKTAQSAKEIKKIEDQLCRVNKEIQKKKNEWLKKLSVIKKIASSKKNKKVRWLYRSEKNKEVKKQALEIRNKFYEFEKKRQRLEEQLDKLNGKKKLPENLEEIEGDE